jgi:hypothetical protein
MRQVGLVIALVACKTPPSEPSPGSNSMPVVASDAGIDAAPPCDPSQVTAEFPPGMATSRACALFGSWLLLDGVRPYYALEVDAKRVRLDGAIYDRRVMITPCGLDFVRTYEKDLLELVWFQYWLEPDGPVFTRDAIGERHGNQVVVCYAQDYLGDPTTGECTRASYLEAHGWSRERAACRFHGEAPHQRLTIQPEREHPFELRVDGDRLIGVDRGSFPQQIPAVRVPSHEAAVDAIRRAGDEHLALGPIAIAAGGKPGDLTTILGAWATLHGDPSKRPEVVLPGQAIACATSRHDRRVSEIAVVPSAAHIELAVLCSFEGTCPDLARLAPIIIEGTLAIDKPKHVLGVYGCKHRPR